MFTPYCEQLLGTGWTHTMNIHISEAELVSGTVMANWSNHARRREAVPAVGLHVSIAFDMGQSSFSASALGGAGPAEHTLEGVQAYSELRSSVGQ
jgi:hypothetical protein